MPWDAQGRWIPEDDSVVTRLNGLLSSDSPFIQQARTAGMRTASRRGLLNSSIAAGAAEAAAIAAGAPLASQDAQMVAQRNQAVLEGGINLTNQTQLQAQQIEGQRGLQQLQDTGSMSRLQFSENAALERQQLQQTGATEAQMREFDQRTQEQVATLASQERQQLLSSDTAIQQTRIAAATGLSGNYLDAFSALAQQADIPADARNAYMAEFQRVFAQGQALAGLATPTLNWGGAVPTAPTGDAPTGIPTGMVYENGGWSMAA